MTKIFLDDERELPEYDFGYTSTRTYQSCIILLDVLDDIEVVNLDYALGGKETGYDVLVYMYEHNIHPKEIIIHSTHPTGVKKMQDYAKEHFSDSLCSLHPM